MNCRFFFVIIFVFGATIQNAMSKYWLVDIIEDRDANVGKGKL